MRGVGWLLAFLILSICSAAIASSEILHSLDAAKKGDYRSLVTIATTGTSSDAGTAARALANYNLRSGNDEYAYGWFERAACCQDRALAAAALGCQGNLLLRQGDWAGAAYKFKAAAQRSSDRKIQSAMHLKTARCYVALARMNPDMRVEFKQQAALYSALSGTDVGCVEGLAIRFENILDADVRAKDPTDLAYALNPIADSWQAWMADAEGLVDSASDQSARATAQLMMAEVWFNNLHDLDKTIELCRQINVDWSSHRTQAAWARLVWGGALQDQGDLKNAATMYMSIVADFTDKDNMARNNVRAAAMCFAAKCLGRLDRKDEACALRTELLKKWPDCVYAEEVRGEL